MPNFEDTQPNKRAKPSMDELQSIPVIRPENGQRLKQKQTRRWGCSFVLVLLFLYFLAPLRTNLLVLGVDDSPVRGELGRTDTIILATVVPLIPYVGMLGIPRDLWVQIPDVGEQRINTAYFFAEADQAGSGAPASVETVRQTFGVTLRYYLVLHMSGLVDFVDALGGIDVFLEKPIGGLPAGTHHLDGTQALAFVRERYSADDFSRMQQGQIFITALFRETLQPGNMTRLPGAFWALTQVINTNLPVWQWPRLGLAFLRAILFGFDSRTISPDMVIPFQTSGGAQVLAPNWEAINPVLFDIFGE